MIRQRSIDNDPTWAESKRVYALQTRQTLPNIIMSMFSDSDSILIFMQDEDFAKNYKIAYDGDDVLSDRLLDRENKTLSTNFKCKTVEEYD